MSIADIVIDPITILQMTSYFEKNCARIPGATYGFLYAKQIELKFFISLTSPLGTNNQTLEELVARGQHFQKIRRIKSKTTESYFLSYDLVGVYMIRSQGLKQEKKLQGLSAQFTKKGFPYSLMVIVDQTSLNMKFFKQNKQYPYTMEMQPNEKICVDSFTNQNSKSLILSTIKKQTTMISHYNQMLMALMEGIEKKQFSPSQQTEIAQLLDDYDRMKHWNSSPQGSKSRIIQAMNYAILVGLGISKTLSL